VKKLSFGGLPENRGGLHEVKKEKRTAAAFGGVGAEMPCTRLRLGQPRRDPRVVGGRKNLQGLTKRKVGESAEYEKNEEEEVQ